MLQEGTRKNDLIENECQSEWENIVSDDDQNTCISLAHHSSQLHHLLTQKYVFTYLAFISDLFIRLSFSPEFLDHVGFESWSTYPEQEFNLADDSKWEVHTHWCIRRLGLQPSWRTSFFWCGNHNHTTLSYMSSILPNPTGGSMDGRCHGARPNSNRYALYLQPITLYRTTQYSLAYGVFSPRLHISKY